MPTPANEKEDSVVATEQSDPSDEGQELRKVSAKVPLAVWTVAAVSTCERFAFYGMVGPFRTYKSAMPLLTVATRLRRPHILGQEPTLTMKRKLYSELTP